MSSQRTVKNESLLPITVMPGTSHLADSIHQHNESKITDADVLEEYKKSGRF